jgi:Ran GTPase-activating protein (RanGAP) involved in mRNA processing and transport
VQILSLNACGIDNVAFEYLVPALEKNIGLEILDLSYNYMGDDMACYIAKIISNQSERRDEIVWLAGLRGEGPEDIESRQKAQYRMTGDYKSGLQSIILRYNDFKNYVCSEIARVLFYDIYIKSIDLRNNLIEEKGVKDMLNFMQSNKTLLN